EGVDERAARLAPAMPHQGQYRLGLDPIALGRPYQPPLLKAAVKHEVADPPRMAADEGDGYRRALRRAVQSQAVQSRRIDDGVEIIDQTVERQTADHRVGKAIAALVAAHQTETALQPVERRPPDRTAPVMLEMRQPVA